MRALKLYAEEKPKAPAQTIEPYLKLLHQSKDRDVSDLSHVDFSVDNHRRAKMTGLAKSIAVSSLVRIVEFLRQVRATVSVQHIAGIAMLNCPNDGVRSPVC